MERYDVAVIGAGPEGLTAATLLARTGLKVIVLEKNAISGGRAATREFHPGFRASPFADELPSIPLQLFWSLDLARHGALLMPAPASVCVSSQGASVLYADDERMAHTVSGFVAPTLLALRKEISALHERFAERAATAAAPPSRLKFWQRPQATPWPGEQLGQLSLADALAARVSDPALRLHLAADALSGRAASPFLAGTALHLLGGGRSGMALGGLAGLAQALTRAAEEAGAIIRCNAEVSDVSLTRSALGGRRATGVALGGNEEIMARAVLSTLDAKRSFLSLFDWKALPQALVKQAAQFRVRGQRARVLFALDAPPEFSFARTRRRMPSAAPYTSCHRWKRSRRPMIPGARARWRISLPVTLRVPSFADPRLAPPGKAVMTATLSAVPARPFDGPWTADKRALLVKAALAAAEIGAPGMSGRVLASHVVAAPDIEEGLGLTEGDLDGGELAPDQALSFRPWPGVEGGRTQLRGFYLAGPSTAPSPFLTGASGQNAALTLLADLKSGRLP